MVAKQSDARPVRVDDVDNRGQLHNEYINAQLVVGQHYSLPRQERVEADDGGATTVREVMYHFEVLQKPYRLHRVRTLHTVASADDPSLKAPLAVETQPEVVRGEGPDVAVHPHRTICLSIW